MGDQLREDGSTSQHASLCNLALTDRFAPKTAERQKYRCGQKLPPSCCGSISCSDLAGRWPDTTGANHVMKRAENVRDENWYGSFYEIALELGPTGNDALAMQALQALWSQPEVRGPWRERTDFDFQSDVSGITINDVRLYGSLRINDDNEVGCMSHLIREESGADWLDLSIPIGMLEDRFPVSYPLDVATNFWMSDFEERLVKIAAAIYRVAPFRLGLVGEEASGASSAAEITAEDCERGGVLVPLALWRKLAPKRQPVLLPEGLAYVSFLGPHITYGG